jgi:protein O-mannosyl-transferase
MANKKKIIAKQENLLNWKVFVLVAVTFLAYIPSLNNEFVNWDDIVYIMNNDMITSLNWVNLKNMFSSYFMGNYNPLILLSFMFDFHFFRFSAPGYHVHNLMLHLVNALLVYAFFFNLLKRNSNVAITIALLFALHPMHVESVAWVSERKDLLYTVYYFLSLVCYVYYLQKGRLLFYFLTLLFFILSNLSKAQAVTLPIVLILIDYFTTRKFDWKTVLEKIPFFLISLIFGIVAIFAQQANNYVNPHGIPVFQSLFYAPYSLWVYLVKFFIPVNQIAVYEYPLNPEGTIPSYLYLSPLIFPILVFVVWKTFKSHRYVTFGLLFFLAVIFPVLQFLPVGSVIIAERYTYVPYIGLSVIIAVAFWENRSGMTLKNKRIVDYSALFILVLMTVLTWNRTEVWTNSVSLWTDVMKKNPGCVQAYINRAFIYNENKQYDDALADLTDGLKIDSKNYTLYKNRGIIYDHLEKDDLALADYSMAIRNNPEEYKCYLLRGILFTDKFAKHDSAIADFKKYLTHSPDNLDATFNLIIANYKKGSYDSARVYCLKVLRMDPGNKDAKRLLEQIDKIKR